MTETGHTSQKSPTEAADGRPQFIPVLKSDIITALSQTGLTPEQRGDFETLCGFLGSYFHHDFYDELTELKEIYAWFSPSGPRPQKREPPNAEDAYRQLTKIFDSVMTRANFIEVPRADVEALGGEHPLLDVK